MTITLADKARAGRRAALASLNARIAQSENVVSIYERVLEPRRVVPEFHTIRAHDAPAPARAPMLVLENPIAA